MDVSMFLLTVETEVPFCRLPVAPERIIGLTTVSIRGASVTSVITLKEIKAEEK